MEFDSLNVTNIVLFPKIPHPNNLGNFRPISLCNVLYKLVTKTIVNRFKGVYEFCMDSAQSAFVLGRLILDNMLLAYENLHTFRQKRVGRKVFMVMKLDIGKSYDRIE